MNLYVRGGKMNIVVGGFYHESNTFNPFETTTKDLVLVEGNEVLNRLASTEVFKENDATLIPTIFASGLSSGILTEKTYRYYADILLNVIEQQDRIDGIWLHLHGAMTVQHIGSGELQLLKEIREIIGDYIPISLTLDIHGNNDITLKNYANIIRSYRTVPHTDQDETERITADLLVKCIYDKNSIKPALIKVPMVIGGEKALGNKEPLLSIFEKLREIESVEGISTASFFIGFAWADTEVSSASVVVIPESEADLSIAKQKSNELAEYVYSKRYEFEFASPILETQEAIKVALESDKGPVFISDSGDNTTGGAVGINTVLLQQFLSGKSNNGKKVCIASIYDDQAFKECEKVQIGDEVNIHIGIDYDENSQSIPVTGILKNKGDLLGYLGVSNDKVGEVYVISTGNIDVVVANKGDSFITLDHFSVAGLDIEKYDIIVVKQGYLFSELVSISAASILAKSPGATYQYLEELTFKHLSRPIFPLDA